MSIRSARLSTEVPRPRAPRAVLSTLLVVLAPAGALAGAPCAEWSSLPTPNVGDSVTRLTSVSALSADDAWAVGLWRDVSGVHGPLALRWNGAAWSQAALPETAHLGSSPDTAGVEAASNGDVWVVGSVFAGYPYDNRPLVLRWRNGSWDSVEAVTLRPQTVHPFAPRGGRLTEAAALAPDDIWAVGQAAGFGDAGATMVPLAVHWDGSGWTDVEVPRIANRHHELTDVVAISADDVWAVGDYRNIGGSFRAVTYHWDGAGWSHVPSPIEEFPSSGLEDVVATGPNDVWALGSASGVGVVVMHWDGDQWSLVPSPPNSGGSLAAVGPDEVWASGWDGFWRWDGSVWNEAPAAAPGSTYVIRNGGMEIVAARSVWCVGYWTLEDGITSSTLAELLAATGLLAGDANGDHVVNFADLNIVLSQFGQSGPGLAGDVTGDGSVNFADLNVVLSAFGATC